jgi:hypothetical protein
MSILEGETFEVAISELTLNSDAIDLSAGSETEIQHQGHIGRKAGWGGFFASSTSHPREIKGQENLYSIAP